MNSFVWVVRDCHKKEIEHGTNRFTGVFAASIGKAVDMILKMEAKME
jgi:hypothetical protein